MNATLLRAARGIVPPVAFGALFLLAWQVLVDAKHIKPYVLPSPSAIWHQVSVNVSDIADAARNTGSNALIGLVLGILLGALAAMLASRFGFVNGMLSPIAAAVAAMPIVALAPVFGIMFSATSTVPRRLVVLITVFFPIYINTVRGLRQVSQVHEDLLHSYAVGGWPTLRTIRVPAALPFFFTGVRVAASVSVISAVVVEYFGGLQDGLGYQITSAAAATAYARAWSFVLGAIALGLIFYLIAAALERVAIPWRQPDL